MIRIISISSIGLVLRSALLSLSKDARVSKDGHKRDRARGHPSRRPREERGLLRMRSESLISIVRYDWFHGIDRLVLAKLANAAMRQNLPRTVNQAVSRHRGSPWSTSRIPT